LDARADGRVEYVLDELRRLFDFRELMQLANDPSDASYQLRAIRTAGAVHRKCGRVGRRKFAVEIFAQPLFRNFAVPVHFNCSKPLQRLKPLGLLENVAVETATYKPHH
jgi:hypothetical protein